MSQFGKTVLLSVSWCSLRNQMQTFSSQEAYTHVRRASSWEGTQTVWVHRCPGTCRGVMLTPLACYHWVLSHLWSHVKIRCFPPPWREGVGIFDIRQGKCLWFSNCASLKATELVNKRKSMQSPPRLGSFSQRSLPPPPHHLLPPLLPLESMS